MQKYKIKCDADGDIWLVDELGNTVDIEDQAVNLWAESDAEIARLKSENKRLLDLSELQDNASEAALNKNISLRSDNELLKAALRWALESGAFKNCAADGVEYISDVCGRASIPPQFAPLIAEATR